MKFSKRLRRLIFIHRVRSLFRELGEAVFGVECARCGVRVPKPVPSDWRWLTMSDGVARRHCGRCRRMD